MSQWMFVNAGGTYENSIQISQFVIEKNTHMEPAG